MGTFSAIQGPLQTRSTTKLESYSLAILHPISSRALTSPPMPCPILCGLRVSWVYPGLWPSWLSLPPAALSYPNTKPEGGEGHFHLGCSGFFPSEKSFLVSNCFLHTAYIIEPEMYPGKDAPRVFPGFRARQV